jgi:hypothetical protein
MNEIDTFHLQSHHGVQPFVALQATFLNGSLNRLLDGLLRSDAHLLEKFAQSLLELFVIHCTLRENQDYLHSKL